MGQGTLSVIRDMGLKEPYVGQTLLQTGEIAEDLTYYFAQADQHSFNSALAAVTGKDRLQGIRHRRTHALQQKLQHLLREEQIRKDVRKAHPFLTYCAAVYCAAEAFSRELRIASSRTSISTPSPTEEGTCSEAAK